MSRGVTDLNIEFLGKWGFHPEVSYHVFKQAGVRAVGHDRLQHGFQLRNIMPVGPGHDDR